MTIYKKLLGAFGLVALICAVVGGVGWYGIGKVAQGLTSVTDLRLPVRQTLGELMEYRNELLAVERKLINPSLSYRERQELLAAIPELWKKLDAADQGYQALPLSAEEKALYGQMKTAWNQWKIEHEKLLDLARTVKLDQVQALETILVARQLDHVKWVGTLDMAIQAGRPFTGQLDPTLCGLGKWMTGYTTDDPAFRDLLGRFNAPHEKLHGLGARINALLAQGNAGAARALFSAEVKPTLAAIEEVFVAALTYVQEDIKRLDQALAIAFGPEKRTYEASEALLDQLSELSAGLAKQAQAKGDSLTTTSRTLMAAAVLVGVTAALLLGWLSARSIAGPMGQAVRALQDLEQGHLDVRLNLQRQDEIGAMAKSLDALADNLQHETIAALQRLAKGDLTFTATPRDERDAIRSALRTLGNDLNAMVGRIQAASEQIAGGSIQVSDSSQSLSQGATETASSLEQIAASMTQIAAQIHSSAANAGKATQLASAACKAANKGNEQVGEMIAAIRDIGASGQNTLRIIKVIDEIAFQTNLLALNAAVEAARAGVHGKGFAVVAEEVRNLAARSAKAAKETAELIEGTVSRTERGMQVADQTGAALQEIVRVVDQVGGLVTEIATAAGEQSEGVSQTSQALSQIDQVTQQNTANAEEIAATAEELSSQVVELRDMLARFTLRDRRGQAAAPLQPSPRPAARTAASPETGWGNLPAPAPTAATKARPVIDLDDQEFGRY